MCVCVYVVNAQSLPGRVYNNTVWRPFCVLCVAVCCTQCATESVLLRSSVPSHGLQLPPAQPKVHVCSMAQISIHPPLCAGSLTRMVETATNKAKTLQLGAKGEGRRNHQ